ncbi:hypothetical protein ABDB91_18515 [Desulfoscipio sp. XC116]|uniref:hypothetical protein n=1 Tax=Desulfoscipio sp. XC116 TaxID=3144975 RepID=UPI00325C0379
MPDSAGYLLYIPDTARVLLYFGIMFRQLKVTGVRGGLYRAIYVPFFDNIEGFF